MDLVRDLSLLYIVLDSGPVSQTFRFHTSTTTMALQERDNMRPGEMDDTKIDPIANDRNESLSSSSHSGSQVETVQPGAKSPRSSGREILFLAVLCSAQLFTQAGLAMSILPQRIIAKSFGIENDPGTLSWFAAGYSLTVGTFILIAGRLGKKTMHT